MSQNNYSNGNKKHEIIIVTLTKQTDKQNQPNQQQTKRTNKQTIKKRYSIRNPKICIYQNISNAQLKNVTFLPRGIAIVSILKIFWGKIRNQKSSRYGQFSRSVDLGVSMF